MRNKTKIIDETDNSINYALSDYASKTKKADTLKRFESKCYTISPFGKNQVNRISHIRFFQRFRPVSIGGCTLFEI